MSHDAGMDHHKQAEEPMDMVSVPRELLKQLTREDRVRVMGRCGWCGRLLERLLDVEFPHKESCPLAAVRKLLEETK